MYRRDRCPTADGQKIERRASEVYIVVAVFASGILFPPFLAVEDGTKTYRGWVVILHANQIEALRHSFGQLRTEG